MSSSTFLSKFRRRKFFQIRVTQLRNILPPLIVVDGEVIVKVLPINLRILIPPLNFALSPNAESIFIQSFFAAAT